MSRSYHITKNQAARSFSEGDVEAVGIYAEKRNVKASHQKYRRIYGEIHPSGKSPVLKNSVTQSSVRKVMKVKTEQVTKRLERPDA